MTTYLAFAKKTKLTISNFECAAIGQIQLVDEHLQFTTINLYPKIYLFKEEDKTLANAILLNTYKHCIVANSINPLLIHHDEVLIEKKG